MHFLKEDIFQTSHLVSMTPTTTKLEEPHILNELIEKIVVHEKVVAEDGSKSQQVDIYYKFIGCVNWKREPASYGTIEAAVLQEHQTLSEQTA